MSSTTVLSRLKAPIGASPKEGSVKTRFGFVSALVCSLTLCLAPGVFAQSTTATISGRVTDSQGLALPGVTVTAESSALQGTRTTVTSDNGDYILSLLPSGAYTLKFELSGFETQQRTVNVAPTQSVPADATLGVG